MVIMKNKYYDCGYALNTQKQDISTAIYLLGVYPRSGTILHNLYLIFIKECEQGILPHLKTVDKLKLKEVKQFALNKTSKKQ